MTSCSTVCVKPCGTPTVDSNSTSSCGSGWVLECVGGWVIWCWWTWVAACDSAGMCLGKKGLSYLWHTVLIFTVLWAQDWPLFYLYFVFWVLLFYGQSFLLGFACPSPKWQVLVCTELHVMEDLMAGFISLHTTKVLYMSNMLQYHVYGHDRRLNSELFSLFNPNEGEKNRRIATLSFFPFLLPCLLAYMLVSTPFPIPLAVPSSIITFECQWHFTGSFPTHESKTYNRKKRKTQGQKTERKLLCGIKTQQVTFCSDNWLFLDLCPVRGLRQCLIF